MLVDIPMFTSQIGFPDESLLSEGRAKLQKNFSFCKNFYEKYALQCIFL